jgi:hypothetical protein
MNLTPSASEHLATPRRHDPNLEGLPRVPRTNALGLDHDPTAAACQVLAALAGDGILPMDAFNTLAAHSRALHDDPNEEILDSLTRQSTLLEGLWLHFAARAATEPRQSHATALCKAALSCQHALQGCLGAICQLTERVRNAKALEC